MSESSKAVNAATAWKLKYINFLLIFFKAYMFERTITPKVFISNDCGSQIQASSETEKNGEKKSLKSQILKIPNKVQEMKHENSQTESRQWSRADKPAVAEKN